MLLCKWGLDTFTLQGLSPLNFVFIVYYFYFSEINASYHSVADSYHCVHFNIALTWNEEINEFSEHVVCSSSAGDGETALVFPAAFGSGWCWIAWNSKWHGNENGNKLYNYRLFWNKIKNTEQCVAEFFALCNCVLTLELVFAYFINCLTALR